MHINYSITPKMAYRSCNEPYNYGSSIILVGVFDYTI